MTTNLIRVRIKRLLNNTPVEIAVFEAEIKKDKDNNLTIINEEQFFKEDLAFVKEPLIEDISRKVKNRFDSKEEQKKALDIAIRNQEERLNRIVAGKLKPIPIKDKPVVPEKDWEKVNKISEECKLRLLKVTKFTIENEGEGSFEQIESDGMRCITYIAQDSHLTPIYIKVPNDTKTNEPITMFKDESLKRKYNKEVTDVITSDYLDSMNDPVSKTLSIIAKVLLVITVLGSIFLFMHNLNWSKELAERETNLLEEWKTSPIGVCQNAIAQTSQYLTTEVESNRVLIDYAKEELKKSINQSTQTEQTKVIKI